MRFPSFRCTAYNNESRKWSDSGVQATLSDKRRSVCNEELGIAYFEAEVLTQTDYYPFGMMMPDRQWSAGAEGYRYGFNGMERDDEVSGNSYTTLHRIYDARLGRWLSTDPEYYRFYGKSPFVAFSDNPLIFIDPKGNTDYYSIKGKKIGTDNDPNGKKVIVLGRVNERQVRRQMKENQKVVSSNIEGIIPVVSNTVIEAIENVYTAIEKNTKQEAGFVSGVDMNGQDIITSMAPNENKRSIDPDPALNEQVSKGGSIEFVVHGHPKYKEKTSDGHMEEGGFAEPSIADLDKMSEIEELHPDAIGVVAGYDLPTENRKFASGERTLNFFSSKDKKRDKDNRGLKIGFDEYKKVVDKINQE